MNISRYIPFRIIRKDEYDECKESLLKRAEWFIDSDKLIKENATLTRERDELQAIVDSRKHPAVDVRLGDPSPLDSKARALYVAQVAGLHKDILEPKFKQMISAMHQMLEDSTNDREFDQALKGAIYFAWEVIRWGTSMVNEQISIQRGERPELSE